MNVKMNKRIRNMKKAAQRGVTLVEVLIVLAIMAVISGVVVGAGFPYLKKSRIKGAVLSAKNIKTQAQAHMQLDMAGGNCPTVKELVDAKKIDKANTDDPWNSPFKIQCDGDEISVVSPGSDKKEGTPDDIKDDFRDADIERVAAL